MVSLFNYFNIFKELMVSSRWPATGRLPNRKNSAAGLPIKAEIRKRRFQASQVAAPQKASQSRDRGSTADAAY